MEKVIITVGNVEVVEGPLSYELEMVANKLQHLLGADEDGEKPVVTLIIENGEPVAWLDNEPIDYGDVLHWALATRCRHCDTLNPFVYLAPRFEHSLKTVVCLDCATSKGWLDNDGMLKPGINL